MSRRASVAGGPWSTSRGRRTDGMERPMKRLAWIVFFVVLVAAAWASVVAAQQPTPSDDDVNRIARQLYCPVCQNTPLDVCPTQACAQWRDLIREKLAAGWSDDQIKQYFVDQYGVRVLSEPPSGYWLVYTVPFLLLAVGLYILYRAYMSMRRKPVAVKTESTASPASGSDEYLSRVEDELKKRN